MNLKKLIKLGFGKAEAIKSAKSAGVAGTALAGTDPGHSCTVPICGVSACPAGAIPHIESRTGARF